MRDTIFISHANPENNYFAAWLTSKLRLLGFKVWTDVSDIKPGQYFNRDYERVIKEEAIRFLSIVSNDYILKSKVDDTGVMNEILCARTVKNIDGFIIPLLYDDSDYGEFTTGLRGRQAVTFNNNWATGLHELVKHFEEAGIPRKTNQDNIIQFWHEAQKIKSEPIEKEEKYFTNWFPINFPSRIFIHEPEVFIERDFALMPFTYIREGARLISFVSDKTVAEYSRLKSSISFSPDAFFTPETIAVDKQFQLIEPNKKLVKLLNKVFRSHLIRNHLKKYEQSSRKEIFYFPFSDENKRMVSLKNLGKSRRNIMGSTTDFTWHFAISHSASLSPVPCLRIFYHLVFTDNYGKILSSDDQHELRRSLPSGWFNRKWLETLLAMMLKIGRFDNQNLIKIPIDKNNTLSVGILPIDLLSPIGYIEPNNEIETGILS